MIELTSGRVLSARITPQSGWGLSKHSAYNVRTGRPFQAAGGEGMMRFETVGCGNGHGNDGGDHEQYAAVAMNQIKHF